MGFQLDFDCCNCTSIYLNCLSPRSLTSKRTTNNFSLHNNTSSTINARKPSVNSFSEKRLSPFEQLQNEEIGIVLYPSGSFTVNFPLAATLRGGSKGVAAVSRGWRRKSLSRRVLGNTSFPFPRSRLSVPPALSPGELRCRGSR